jgi:hypothetical protein
MGASNKGRLDFVTSILEREVEATEEKLKTATSEKERGTLIGQISALKASQKLLSKCFEYQIRPGAVWRVIPAPQHQFSEYRLLEDFDTDNQDDWKEVLDIRPCGSDILIG